MRRFTSCLWIAAGILCAPEAGHAVLIEIDIIDPSGALVSAGATRDSESGLDWLDVPLLSGVAFNDVLAGAGPGVGWVNDGWRYATTDEVCALFGALGDVIASCPENPDMLSPGSAATFRSLLGSEFGVTGGLFDDGDGGDVGVGCICLGDLALALTNAADPGPTAGSVGAFLVREVPEPGTGLLLATGVLAIGVGGRTRLERRSRS